MLIKNPHFLEITYFLRRKLILVESKRFLHPFYFLFILMFSEKKSTTAVTKNKLSNISQKAVAITDLQ